ncbi:MULTISPECIES: isochorismatase family cysteine hydrolase [unclassified Breznakia]|uniref:cysteine hydrolase family protein n=1 Tax=unclassified Breznakia TaxID=2623764 RepID=UPI002473C931|nr:MULTISPECIES: isochorismatase family cysteine hydrolase [unclassified Breznakia]MDH6367119.1 nicotinamidase-related amidase [Breznakia sp. PH1-1]MDH6404294.1 nicotinamidase-related amidase [Breznakia sp. PF1-11]MDH6412006.1 nicotinamidase-related amidase [Breznakia sp. PFB1-11]MDH6414282.1 nicotinamidase-related amidase [Breznakia sp. PFB1-14]MDH6416620.1 nicotinamidase-related amidase [Breznakia sp. PFB1-4]
MAKLKPETMDTLARTSLSELQRPHVFVVDMINGFIKEGALSDSYIMHITNPIQDLVKQAHATTFICDSHNLDAKEFDAYPIHCIKDTSESEVIDELQPLVKRLIHKNSTNTFMAKEFQDQLPDLLSQFDDFVLVGCCTDICILHFALSLQTFINEHNLSDKRVIVPMNMVETYDIPEVHSRDKANQTACELMINNGIQVVVME